MVLPLEEPDPQEGTLDPSKISVWSVGVDGVPYVYSFMVL